MIARQLSFFAPAAVMSAWATVMLHTVVTGRINELLSPMFRNYVIVSAVALLVLSALYLLLYQSSAESAPAFAPTGRVRQLGRWLVLLLPILAAPMLASATMSGDTMVKRVAPGTSIPMPSINDKSKDTVAGALDADPNQPAQVEVTDLLWLSQHPGQMKSFDGHKVRCVGQIVAEGDSGPKLMRGLMWCCAADIQPVMVDLTGNAKGAWKDSDWFEITGTARFPAAQGKVAPAIDVESITPTQEPDEPYLSP